jgi:hypothetical protein
MRERGSEIKTDEAKLSTGCHDDEGVTGCDGVGQKVVGFPSSIVHDDEGAIGCDGMGQKFVGFTKDAMSCGDSGKVGVGTEKIESEFGLRQELRPMIDGEGRVGAS